MEKRCLYPAEVRSLKDSKMDVGPADVVIISYKFSIYIKGIDVKLLPRILYTCIVICSC